MAHWETQQHLYGTDEEWLAVQEIEEYTCHVYKGLTDIDLFEFIFDYEDIARKAHSHQIHERWGYPGEGLSREDQVAIAQFALYHRYH